MNTTLTVFKQAGTWVVTRDGRRSGEYAFKVDAEKRALQLAAQWRAKGETVDVLVQGDFGEIMPLADARRGMAAGKVRGIEPR